MMKFLYLTSLSTDLKWITEMGQAKLKGTFEQRRAQAIADTRARFPASVKCNNCEADLEEIHAMDVRGMPGLQLAGAAICPACSHTTWVLDGSPEALQRFQEFMAAEHGEEAKTGVAVKPRL